jgi:electron transfer flavoprotein alpha subunit
MSVLILAEHHGHKLSPSVYRAATAAAFWQAPIHVVLIGNDTATVAAEAAQISGVTRVIRVDAQHLGHPLAEDAAEVLVQLAADYRVILGAHTTFTRNILPRVAAMHDVAMISDALEIQPDNTYVRAIYAGSVLSVVQSNDALQVLTIHANRFKPAPIGANAEIVSSPAPAPFGKTRWISEHRASSDRPSLNSAKIVVSGGRSLGSAEKFSAVLEPLAEKLGAALGATRAAVDAGYAPNDIQVGQTGTMVAPELYIAVGVSGAVQHTAGMKDSRIIVAINHDPDAPIFKVADYGLVADLFETVPQLAASINQQ